MRKILYTFVFFLAQTSLTSYSSINKKELFKTFASSYFNLYEMSPSCFFAYDKDKEQSYKSLYFKIKGDICSGSMASFCENEKKIVHKTLEKSVFHLFQANKDSSKQCFVPERTHELFSLFRKDLLTLRDSFHTDIKSLMSSSEQDSEKFMVSLRNIYQNKREKVGSFFNSQVTDEILNSSHRVILLPLLVRLAAGDFFKLDPADIIRALENEKKNCKKKFLEIYKKNKIYSLNNFGVFQDRKDLFLSKEIFRSYDFKGDFYFTLFNKFGIQDKRVVYLLLEKKYQRVLWLLRELGHKKKENSLEKFIRDELLNDKKIQTTINLGLGFTDTFRIFYKNNASVIYKPKVSFFENPIKSMSSNPNRESVAYVLDCMLKLNAVPMTFVYTDKEKGKGSSQYFITDSYRARDMKDYSGTKPRKFTEATGRIEKDSHMVLFDWLTDNKDRNADNYMVLDTGKVVFIDHSLSFMEISSPRRISNKDLKKMMPSKKVFAVMKKISKKPRKAYSKLGPYLSKKQIRILVNKIKLFVKLVGKREKNGEKIIPFAMREILY